MRFQRGSRGADAMILVVDANILFAALIKARGTRSVLLFSDNNFYTPEHSIQEFKKHLPTLQKKMGLPEKEIIELLEKLVEESETKIIPFEEFKYCESQAKEISPDPDDVAYIALALHLGCPLWSNDKALKKQTTIKVYSTQELVQRLEQ